MNFPAIVLLCVVSAMTYGILHDQITARICVEYFTIGHAPVFQTDSPTLLAFGWGIIATWWMGVLMGIPLAMTARLGARPKRSVQSLIAPVSRLLAIMAGCALCAGVVGYLLARLGAIALMEPLASRVPAAKHVTFLVDLWAHSASYFAGFVGGIILAVRTWHSRNSLPANGAA